MENVWAPQALGNRSCLTKFQETKLTYFFLHSYLIRRLIVFILFVSFPLTDGEGEMQWRSSPRFQVVPPCLESFLEKKSEAQRHSIYTDFGFEVYLHSWWSVTLVWEGHGCMFHRCNTVCSLGLGTLLRG